MWPDAIRAVRINFMLEKIAEEKGFAVSDEELELYIANMAIDMNIALDRAKEIMEKNMEQIRMNMELDNAIDYLIDNAVVTETDAEIETESQDEVTGEEKAETLTEADELEEGTE
jgi:trigger factor